MAMFNSYFDITRGLTSIFLWFSYGFPIKTSIFLWFMAPWVAAAAPGPGPRRSPWRSGAGSAARSCGRTAGDAARRAWGKTAGRLGVFGRWHGQNTEKKGLKYNYIYICINIYVYMYINIYVYMYIYIWIHYILHIYIYILYVYTHIILRFFEPSFSKALMA